MATTLTLSNAPGKLVFEYVLGDPWTAQLDYQNADQEPAAWPAAPVLEFAATTVPDVTATLSTANGAADSRATWNIDEATIALLRASSSRLVRLVVGGVTWYAGTATPRA